MVGPVPANATLIAERPDALVAPGYLQASGTSFSAPAVAGAAAQILARHPAFTPDQVKGALMLGAKPAPNAAPGSLGVGELDATRSAGIASPPNPNRALERFLGLDPSGGSLPAFNAISWLDAAKADKSWDAISWTDIGWSDAAWSAVSWEEVAWSDISWTDISWTDVSWADVSWTDSAKEDAADADASYDGSYELTPEDVAAMAADPTAAAPADALPADLSSSGS
jgi:subtilisin family serine protease